MSHHLTQVVDLFINEISTALPLVNVYDNDALAIDDPGESIGVYVVNSLTTVEGEQRFNPTYGSETVTVVVVGRAGTNSSSPRRDALELVGKAQDAIYASQTIDDATNAVERTDLVVENEIRSENQTAFAAQSYAVKYLTADDDYQKIINY